MKQQTKQQLTKLPRPSEIIAHLDRFVLGHAHAKRDLAVSVYNHYIGASYAETPHAKYNDLERQHILLLGSTGSGKTYLVRTLADYLGVPLSVASATSFSEAGFVGDNVESLVANLLNVVKGDVSKAQRGIVYIDEIDKIKRGNTGFRDVSGEGVQAGLLTLLDGREMTLRHRDGGTDTIDVSRILFICTGAFSGLTEIVRRRVKARTRNPFGFGPHRKDEVDASTLSDDTLLQQLDTEDLETFGMLPEFIGRFATITALRTLSNDDLVKILTDAEGSALAKQTELFRLHGIKLEFDAKALKAIAAEAAALETGARALKRIVLRTLDSVDYRLPELAESGVTHIRITEDAVLNNAEPVMKKRKKGTKVPPTEAEELRTAALEPARIRGELPVRKSPLPEGLTNVKGWSTKRILDRLEEVKTQLDWANTTGSAKKWWEAFEKENNHRPALVLRLAEELANREATVTDFFLAYVYSNTDNIQANLHYLDYSRLKREEEKKRRDKK